MKLTDLRGILQYVPQFREKTFVVAVDGAIVTEDNFGNILMDVAVLWSLSIRTVLVHGAAGAVGIFAVQLARWCGATVIGTASAHNEAFVRDLGADEVID